MSHNQPKKGKKPHHKVQAPKKKSKTNDKRHKKKEGTKRAKSSTKLNEPSKISHRKQEDEVSIMPGITSSDGNVLCPSDQPSAPTKIGKVGSPKQVSMRASTPTSLGPPIPSPSTPEPPPPPTPKWKAEEVALKYVERLDAATARQEFIEVCGATQVNVERDCQIWKRNFTKNQSDAYPMPDSTLVKIQNQPDDYVNMSSVTVPHVQYPVLMGQVPKKGLEEEFWKAVFQEGVVLMYVLIGSGEEEKIEFFPSEMGGFIYHGKMFVNIRKVEKMDDERTLYTIEILPNGMSNSNMIHVYVHTGWEPFAVPVKFANTTRSVVDVMNFVKTSNGAEKLLVVSRNGAGRAGFFLSLGAAFCCLNDQFEPRIVEIVRAIRTQRPNAVAGMKQYSSLYLCLLYYIKKKSTIPESLKPKLEEVTKALENLIREDLSIMY